jgi:RNA polymerase sigma-70 factor (ECF subfamily)
LDETADSELLRRAREGSSAACDELVGRYQDRVYTVALGYLRDVEEALDVTQEAFVRLLRALPQFREEAGLYTWLYRVTVNLCIDRQRRAGRRPAASSLEELRYGEGAALTETRKRFCPQEALATRELREQIDAAIAALDERFRVVVILADIEGLSQREIARIVGCPVNTVKTRLHRGRLLIRERLKPYLAGEEGALA